MKLKLNAKIEIDTEKIMVTVTDEYCNGNIVGLHTLNQTQYPLNCATTIVEEFEVTTDTDVKYINNRCCISNNSDAGTVSALCSIYYVTLMTVV